ncbi:hypothetical protein [Chlamydiifrater volucris]|uniref:hypothetical protein n=1 Tax=Chlamydiifrater volucris TaxID=2681470 RepID=UPI001BCDC860|nr:hypothetical protein [Chlamydiifrater volucris]
MISSLITTFQFSPKFMESKGGCLEKSISILDRILSVSPACICFLDVSENGSVVIEEKKLPIPRTEVIIKVFVGVLLLPLTIIAFALKIILKTAFYYKYSHKGEWVKFEEPKLASPQLTPTSPELTAPEPLEPRVPDTPSLDTSKLEPPSLSPEEQSSITSRLVVDLGMRESSLLQYLYEQMCLYDKDTTKNAEDFKRDFGVEFLFFETIDPGKTKFIKWEDKFPGKSITFYAGKILSSPSLGDYGYSTSKSEALNAAQRKRDSYEKKIKEWKGSDQEKQQLLSEKTFIQVACWEHYVGPKRPMGPERTPEKMGVIVENLPANKLLFKGSPA